MKTLCGSAPAAAGNRGCFQHWRFATAGRACRGFTLIELLVVVSIIALLISILLPSLRTAREQAKLVRCATNQRGMGQAGFTFAEDHGGRFQLVSNSVGVDKADSNRNRFEYTPSDRELLSWPVAMARAASFDWEHNWQWGARADGPDEAVLQVGAPAHEVQQPPLDGVPEHGVDGEVAAPGVLRGAAEGHGVGVATVGVGRVLPEGCHLVRASVHHDRADAELAADRIGVGEEGLDLLGPGAGCHVVVARLAAQEHVAHAAPGEEGLVAGLAQAAHDALGAFAVTIWRLVDHVAAQQGQHATRR